MEDDSRSVESWTWYGFAVLFTLCRFASRAIRLGGVQNFALEDYVMILAFSFYTNVIVWVNIQGKHPRTNILPPSGTEGMALDEIDDRIYGSIITFTIEESMVVLQMLCKVCMCLLFMKLTSGLRHRQLVVKCLLGYVIGGWTITEIFFFGVWCRPFQDYFRVFTGNSPGCTTSQKHLMMSFAFNITSDLLILAVPIPMLLQSQLPWKQKFIICGIFSLGIFVILASVLNRYYCFAHPESILWIYWYVREASTAIIVTNVPHCYALPRKISSLGAFTALGSIFRSRKRLVRAENSNSGGGGGATDDDDDMNDMNDIRTHQKAGSGKKRDKQGSSDSTDNFAWASQHSSVPRSTLQIWQRNEYSVDANETSDAVAEATELQTIWAGGMGTIAKVEVNSEG